MRLTHDCLFIIRLKNLYSYFYQKNTLLNRVLKSTVCGFEPHLYNNMYRRASRPTALLLISLSHKFYISATFFLAVTLPIFNKLQMYILVLSFHILKPLKRLSNRLENT